MVLANRIPVPPTPMSARNPGGGAFAAGLDVYTILSLFNPQGETLPSAASVVVNTNLNDAINVTIPALASFPGWVQGLVAPYEIIGAGVYNAVVATGSPAPPICASLSWR